MEKQSFEAVVAAVCAILNQPIEHDAKSSGEAKLVFGGVSKRYECAAFTVGIAVDHRLLVTKKLKWIVKVQCDAAHLLTVDALNFAALYTELCKVAVKVEAFLNSVETGLETV